MSSVPSVPERSDSTINNTLLSQHYNQPISDSDLDANQNRNEDSKQPSNQSVVTFYCDFHKKVFKLASQNVYKHFKTHLDDTILLSDYRIVESSRLVDIYEKTFEDDDLVMDPFEGQELTDLVDLVRVGGSLKQRAKVIISFNVVFESADNEDDIPKSTWMSLSQFQIIRNELGVRNKIQEKGKAFVQSLLDLDSIEDSGSGWIYLGMKKISIKIIRSAKFGCNTSSYEFSDKIKALVKQRILYNPPGEDGCFQKCITHFFKTIFDDPDYVYHHKNLKTTMTLKEIEEWSLQCRSMNLQIFTLTKNESNDYNVQPMFISSKTPSQQEVSLLAIFNENSCNSAHFMRILDIEKLFKRTNFIKSHKKHKLCQFCYSFSSEREYIVDRHELNCLENPNSIRDKKTSSERFEFPTQTTYLKCRNERCRNPPNWIGFLDFETVSQSVEGWGETIEVCPTHRLKGKKICDCSFTSSSEKIKSLSYNLLIVDFHEKEVVYENFYIRKQDSDPDAGQHLAQILSELAYAFTLLHQINYPMEMTLNQQINHNLATHCELCHREFAPKIKEQDLLKNIGYGNLEGIKIPCKVADHLHHRKEGNFLRTLCSKCNLAVQSRRLDIPILCHNFSRFDHVFLLKYLCKTWGNNTKVIAKSSNQILSIFALPFVLKDSLKFLSGSLDSNVELLKESCYVTCAICTRDNPCDSCQHQTLTNFFKNFETISQSDMSTINGIFSTERFQDNLKKAAFPYSILSSYADLKNMVEFPQYETFYSIIKNKNVEIEEYKAAKLYFEKYCSNMLDFLELYNRLDCHLLYSCWTAMSTILQSNFELYPENFHTLPAYSFEVAKLALRTEEDELETCIELFDEENKDIYFKAMNNIRGGIVMSNCKFKLDSSFQDFLLQKENVESKYASNHQELVYIDATNLYGYSLSSLLPYKNYELFPAKLVDELNETLAMDSFTNKITLLETLLPDDDSKGYAFDVKIISIPEYLYEFPPFFAHKKVSPRNLSAHDLNQYKTLYGQSFGGSKGETLVPMLENQESYFTHYRNMKEAVKLGVQLRILGGIMFDQKYLFKNYLETLSKLRSQTKNPVYKKAFKLMPNSLFGKTLQNPLSYADDYHFYSSQGIEIENVTGIQSKISERNYRNKPFLFKDIKIFDKDFFMVQTQRQKVKATNCPLIAFCVLELAKLRNLSFYWKMKKISPSTQLLYCDTDSFILACSKSWYSKMRDIKEDFDFFDAPHYIKNQLGLTHPEMLSAKGEIGRYKFETKQDSILVGFIALQKKAYCLLILEQQKCNECDLKSSCKHKKIYKLFGNATAKRLDTQQLRFQTYLDALRSIKVPNQLKRKFEQRDKNLHFVMKKYKSLNSFDNSNFTKNCGIHNVPFSARNLSNYDCHDPFCKHICQPLLSTFSQKIDDLFEKKFHFLNGELCIC